MLIYIIKNAALVGGFSLLAAIILAGLREEVAARRKCRPVQTIVGFRQIEGGYSPDSDKPSIGWPATICALVAVLSLAYAFMHVAVAAGF